MTKEMLRHGQGEMERVFELCRDNTVSLREREIPSVGKGTLASVSDGKGTLRRRLQTGGGSIHYNVMPSPAMFDGQSGSSTRSLFNPVLTRPIDAVSIFPMG